MQGVWPTLENLSICRLVDTQKNGVVLIQETMGEGKNIIRYIFNGMKD